MENITSKDLKTANITRDDFAKSLDINYFSLANKLAGRVAWSKDELINGWDRIINGDPDSESA